MGVPFMISIMELSFLMKPKFYMTLLALLYFPVSFLKFEMGCSWSLIHNFIIESFFFNQTGMPWDTVSSRLIQYASVIFETAEGL